ncbi:MAG: hypothetical protein RXP99_04250 [Vulcanisaeta sp.]
MVRRYLALAMLASALWGVSYPLTYLALRFYDAGQLIAWTYLFSTASLMIILAFKGLNGRSVITGLALSPINYVMVYLYTELSGSVGGLTALVSTGYLIPLILIDYLARRNFNIKYIISTITLLAGLYLLFQGYDDSIYVAVALMVLNLVYALALSYINNADALSLVFGQSIGTLLISVTLLRNAVMLNPQYIYYPLALALIGNTIPYTLYTLAIRELGPVETSLTASMETISSLIASIPMQQIPSNPLAWTLLIISILSISLDMRIPNMGRHGRILEIGGPDYYGIDVIHVVQPRFVNEDYQTPITKIARALTFSALGKRKVI